jgi:hypothetical protein
MTIACYVDVLRLKTHPLIKAFAQGCRGKLITTGKITDADDHAIVAKGLAVEMVPKLQRAGLPFWYLDACYIPIRGYFRVERSNFYPPYPLPSHTMDRALAMGVRIEPWRRNGRHVLLCLPGPNSGREWGIDMPRWWAEAERKLRAVTDRPIVVRPRHLRKTLPLEEQLEDCWAVVTHSSGTALAAILAGVPAFVEPTSAAAPIARIDLEIEYPVRPDREDWIASLAWRQWNLDEMRSGEAWTHLQAESRYWIKA